jgi:hypothetical protein
MTETDFAPFVVETGKRPEILPFERSASVGRLMKDAYGFVTDLMSKGDPAQWSVTSSYLGEAVVHQGSGRAIDKRIQVRNRKEKVSAAFELRVDSSHPGGTPLVNDVMGCESFRIALGPVSCLAKRTYTEQGKPGWLVEYINHDNQEGKPMAVTGNNAMEMIRTLIPAPQPAQQIA